jgi:FkbM family methyltransferase
VSIERIGRKDKMNIRETAKDAIRAALLRAGICVAKSKYNTVVSKERYGIDPWRDVERLSHSLNRPIELCFDVGGNDGETSLALLYRFKDSRIFSSEPHPDTFSALAARINDKRFLPQQIALSDKPGECTLYVYDDNPKINSLAHNARYAIQFKPSNSEITVRTETIDNFCSANQIQEIDILKIDTEGFDLNVLKGAQQMLSSGKVEFVYTEFNDYVLRPGTTGGALNEISEYLARFNFHFVATYTDYIIPTNDLFVRVQPTDGQVHLARPMSPIVQVFGRRDEGLSTR